MPTGCRTTEKQIPQQFTEGRIVTLPWCVAHGRWFAECQCREVLADIGTPEPEPLPAGIVDFVRERNKRKEDGTC